jgi:glutathione synthase/RimK-type ligase-like ATP-grasp enzyme
MRIYTHNEGSMGASELAKALKTRRIKHENSSFRGDSKKTVINWGGGSVPDEVAKCRILNRPEYVRRAANKLHFFADMTALGDASPRLPPFTTSEETAKEWVAAGILVVARTTLNGHSGQGIHFMELNQPNAFVKAPLYVQYVKKKHEYRVHFVGKNIIDYQRKALRPGVDPNDTDWRVRNLDNGFIFVRNDVELPEDVRLQAQKVIDGTALDFGAIDLIYNENSRQAYVLEVNTAPGLTGTTVTNYVNAFKAIT